MANKILEALPRCYQQGGDQEMIADALTRGIDELLSNWDLRLDNYYRERLDPSSADELWLDLLAAWSGWGNYWDSSWSVAIKRQLLTQTNYIWSNRGNKEILPFLFKVFGLNATLAPNSGWIVGTSTVPVTLAADPFSYVIQIPANYTTGSPEYVLIRKLVKQFLPCWIGLDFVTV